MKFYKISSPMFWQLKMHDVEVGGQPFHTNISTVMADTGTSLNLIPDEDFNPLMEKFIYS